MNNYCQLSSIIFILQFLFIFGQDHTESNLTNYTLSQNQSNDSNITWIKIATSTTDVMHSTHCTIETTTIEDQNLDIANSSRRKRRKRRRNKYKATNQRRPEQYKKHSTRVQLDKPVQFLIPPDYHENLIPKETIYYKNRNEVEKFEKKIPPPVRYLLPPFVDPFFIPDPAPREPKKSKVEWSLNSTNRGATKFKHTIYYSDSGNEIISNYDATSTTTSPKPRTESSRTKKYKPIVVQPMPIQYTTQSINNISYEPSKERVNNLVSYEVANAGMQVINMSAYQKQQTQFQNQFVVPQYKQFTPPPLQSPPQQTNYQPYQQLQPPFPNPVEQNYQNQHLPVQTYNQQHNYHQTTYSRRPEIRTTTPAIEITTNRTTTPSESVDGFKGLEIAESKYFSDLPSEQEFSVALQNDGQVIPGIAGKDYPVFDQTLAQKRRFACRGVDGYFADTSSRCQVFYICNGDGAGEPMLCPNGTLFSQELLVCDWWYNVDC